MKKLQMKYNLLHLFYWITYCCVYGFVAIFLHYKGLSNTQIGIVTGLGAAITIITSPYIASLIGKIKGMTTKKLVTLTFIGQFILYALMSFLPLPAPILIILYIALISLMAADVPVLSQICMDYLKDGEYLNFGLSRGIGSLSYASGAAIMGILVDVLNPLSIVAVHVISGIGVLIMLASLPDVKVKEESTATQKISMLTFMKTYKKYTLMLIAFMFPVAAATGLGTYLINIVTHLGGSSSLFGIATFLSAGSELPFMAITHKLLKRFKPVQLLMVASFFYVVRNLTICLAPNLVILIIGLLFQGISYGIFTAVITIYANDYVKSEHGMMAQTLLAVIVTGIGSTIVNFVGGRLQDTFGLSSMLIFMAVMTLIGFVMMLAIYLKGDHNEAKLNG